jgi:hypothetical protein
MESAFEFESKRRHPTELADSVTPLGVAPHMQTAPVRLHMAKPAPGKPLGLSVDDDNLVRVILPGTVAARCGLAVGQILISIDGERLQKGGLKVVKAFAVNRKSQSPWVVEVHDMSRTRHEWPEPDKEDSSGDELDEKDESGHEDSASDDEPDQKEASGVEDDCAIEDDDESQAERSGSNETTLNSSLWTSILLRVKVNLQGEGLQPGQPARRLPVCCEVRFVRLTGIDLPPGMILGN